MRVWATLATALIALLAPCADAQDALQGVLFDSLRTMAPVPSAEVVLLGTSLRARTDTAGRFTFTAAPEGAHAVAFWAPWLDSLGLPPIRAPLTGGRVMLATPSRATFQRAHCGAVLDANQGILLGDVRGTDGMPQTSVLVLAEWEEIAIGRGTVAKQAMATVDTTDATGSYALCGVPTGITIVVQAASAERATGSLRVPVALPEQRFDLVVGIESTTMLVTGRVVELAGDSLIGVAGAALTLVGDSSRAARSDSTGGFEMNVPSRSSYLDVRAVGFRPTDVELTMVGDRLDLKPIQLERVPPQLETVIVTSDPYAHEREGFEYRRSRGLGFFISDSALRRIPQVTAMTVMSMVPRTMARGGRLPVLMLRRGSGFCSPRFFHDGYDVGTLTGPFTPDQVDLLKRAKRIEIYTANMAPPQYNDFDGCGVVVVWTR